MNDGLSWVDTKMTKPYFSALFALLLLPAVLAVAETVTFPSGEITLHGVLYKPEGTGPFPAVIYNHGSAPGMMSKEAFAALGPVFTSHGWVFFGPYRRGQGLSASAGPYIGDQFAALAWLRKQSFVQPSRIAVAGNSFGGIETVLGVERGGYCAGIDSAGGAQSWAQAPELQSLMTRAVRNAKAPIFFFQAANDFDLSPSKTLSAEMNLVSKTYKLKIYPPYGESPRDGHSFGYFGSDVWAEDVFGFLNRHCTK